MAEGPHNGKIPVEVVAAHIHLDAGELPGQLPWTARPSDSRHMAIAMPSVPPMLLMCLWVSSWAKILLSAQIWMAFVAVDDFGTEVVDAAAAEVDVDHGADVGAVEAGDEGVENVDVGSVAGGVDAHGVLEPPPI